MDIQYIYLTHHDKANPITGCKHSADRCLTGQRPQPCLYDSVNKSAYTDQVVK